METGEQQPPARLGLRAGEAIMGRMVRYWPLTGMACVPCAGRIRGASVEQGRDVVWIEGKAGYVLASHCEVVNDV